MRTKHLQAILVITAMTVLLAGCPQTNPYQTARTTITIARTTLRVANTGFMAYEQTHRRSCNDKICSKLHPNKTSAEYKDCMAKDHSAVPEWKTCYGKMAQAVPIFTKSMTLGNALLDEATSAVDLAEELDKIKTDKKKLEEACLKIDPSKGDEYKKCIAGQTPKKADWYAVLKGGACVVYHALDFFPEKYLKYILPVRVLLNGLGNCTAPK